MVTTTTNDVLIFARTDHVSSNCRMHILKRPSSCETSVLGTELKLDAGQTATNPLFELLLFGCQDLKGPSPGTYAPLGSWKCITYIIEVCQ